MNWKSAIAARFARVTTSGRFIAEIDGLRFIAIALVIVFHIAQYVDSKLGHALRTGYRDTLAFALTTQGHYGVQLFFVVSGFVLALPFAAHRLTGTAAVSLKTYFLRRLTRLEPPYVLSLLLFYALLLAAGKANCAILTDHLAVSLAYSHNLYYARQSMINIVAWSLEIEIQFYLLVPLLAAVFTIASRWARRGAILAIAAAAICFQTFFIDGLDANGATYHRYFWSILNYLQYFMLGFLLADLYLTDWNQAPGSHWGWDLVALAGWPLLLAVWIGGENGRGGLALPPGLLWRTAVALLVLALFVAVFRGWIVRRIFTNPLLTTIGGMCYSIYLLHEYLVRSFGKLTQRLPVTDSFSVNLLVQLVLLCGPILIGCGGYFLLIEKPCMRKDWPQQLWQWVRHRRAATTGK